MVLRKGIPQRISDAVMEALALCTVVIGIQGTIVEKNILLLIVAVVLGVFIGKICDLDGRINRAAARITAHFAGAGEAA
ncbi:DUF554 family protein, partial [Anaerovibrio lipolyticus]|uniref:DUF554 family protein n=1 Tax=Anaerovibrio lipolyticus TaxID=82374 RepID=UPI0026E97FC5